MTTPRARSCGWDHEETVTSPAPEFTWNDYEVPSEPRRVARALRADAPAPTATVTITLPDLTPWPSPLEKAEILLQSAAEIEHALMVQYLYAAYSLKSAKDVTDSAQKAVLAGNSASAWPQVLLGIAREEMGHLMTVQNLLLLLGLAPNFEREDFPPRKDLYPFSLHLEPLSQRSLAKYVVAEAPAGAGDIDDVVALATDSAGDAINRVGTLYGLLGLLFTAMDQVPLGGSGSKEWDEIVLRLAKAAYMQAPANAWHLEDGDFHVQTLTQQCDPDDWQVAHLRVHRVADRPAAVQAIRDVGEQGEGPTSEGEQSHFERFLGIFRGRDGMAPFPAAGAWLPTRDIPTNPKVQDIAQPRTRRWAELADIRYALLLGFLEHYLLTSGDDRSILIGWCFAEMRSRVGFIARELTAMPLASASVSPAAAAIAFTLPASLHLPDGEAARWSIHRERTEAAIAKVEEMRGADAGDERSPYLTDLMATDQARLALIDDPAAPRPSPTSFARDILGLFRQKDVEHMRSMGVELGTYDGVRAQAEMILGRVQGSGGPLMPPAPDQRWTKPQIDLVERWIADGFPQ